jgi:integrator complex subunit 7
VDFLQHALSSLSDAIEFKVDCWTKDEDEQSPTSEPPCVLASLLVAAQPLFCFLLPLHPRKGEEEESKDAQYRDLLVSCGIQLLHHWDSEIAQEASNLLEMAFSYGAGRIVDEYSGALFSSIKLAIENDLKKTTDDGDMSITGIIAVVARKCRHIGEAVLKLLMSMDRTEPSNALSIDRLIASVACACPSIADPYMGRIKELLDEKTTSEKTKQQLLAALLGNRRSHFFNKSSDGPSKHLEKGISAGMTGWDLYLLGRQALVSGSYGAAQTIYEELSFFASSGSNYLWLSSLQKIASAEAHLLEGGAMGIPASGIELRSAASTIQSLPSFLGSTPADFAFQLRFLNLRLDFVDIVCSIRQLASEMRLTSVGPKKFTRSSLHLKSAVKLLNVLGTKYLTFYRQHGLFTCQQSRTALRTLHALCRFVSSATQSAFIDELPDFGVESVHQNAILALTLPQGDASHPLTILMKRLHNQVLKDMSGSVDAKIRAAALLQVIDGVLKVPSPFPRGFLRTRPIQRVDYRLYLDSELSDDHGEADDDIEDEVELPAGSMITFFASGSIPESLVKSADLPFYTIIMWHTVSFQKTHTKTINDTDQEKTESDTKSVASETKTTINAISISTAGESNAAPTNAISLSPAGKFFIKLECERLFMEPGKYRIETRLGCRDIRGGEWELSVNDGYCPSLSIRIHKG